MAVKGTKATNKGKKPELLGYLNVTLVKGNGEKIRTPRGFQITTSPDWPANNYDLMLIELAKNNGGKVIIENAVIDIQIADGTKKSFSSEGLAIVAAD